MIINQVLAFSLQNDNSSLPNFALIEKYEMVPRKELLSHHLHFDLPPCCWIREHKNSSE